MAFLLLLLVLCFFLHKMCDERGISPWRYLTGFVAGFIVILLGASVAIIYFYGKNIININDPNLQKAVLIFTPVATVCDLLLFFFMRYRISRISAPIYHHDDDEDRTLPPPSSNEKKDLSYFR